MTGPLRLLGISLVFLVLGCASGFSREVRSQVNYHDEFTALQTALEEHIGKVVMLGGKILKTDAYPSSSEITVLQLPLDSSNRPRDGDDSEGRFLIRSGQFLDPAVYQQWRLLTVVGKLIGSESRSIGGFEYNYPVVEAIEIKPWPWQRTTSPSFHFGIGVGTWF